MTFWRLGLLGFGLSVAASAAAQTQSGAPSISVEQRIEAATRALGYFARSHEYNEFRSVLLTLLEVNGDDNAAAPLNERWDVREQQIKETYGAWFRIFRALDALKRVNYDPLDEANRCYLNIAPARGFPGMDPADVTDPQDKGAYKAAAEDNRIRCERNNLQVLLPRLDEEAEAGLHKFLRSLSLIQGPDGDSSGSYFAYALGKSGLRGDRIDQMWKIFGERQNADWKPKLLTSANDQRRDRFRIYIQREREARRSNEAPCRVVGIERPATVRLGRSLHSARPGHESDSAVAGVCP